MAVARLALLLGAFGALAQGLNLFQEAVKSTAGETPSGESHKRKRRLGAIGASAQWAKARHEEGMTGKTVVDFYQQMQYNHNMSQQYARRKEKMQAKAEELIALREERRRMEGKHAIFNKTLAEERKERGDTNKTGLWIITDEPETKEDRHRRKFQRDLRKQFPMEYNITRFLEAAKQNAETEELYAVREQWAMEQAKAWHKDFQAARQERKESAEVLQSSVAAAKGRMAGIKSKLVGKQQTKKSTTSGAPSTKESAKEEEEEEEEEEEDED